MFSNQDNSLVQGICVMCKVINFRLYQEGKRLNIVIYPRQSGGGGASELGKARRLSGASLVSHGTVFGEMSQKYMTTAHYKGSVVATKNILAKNIRCVLQDFIVSPSPLY